MRKVNMSSRILGFLAAVALSLPGAVQAQSTLRVVMHSDLKILDPVWTTAFIVRNHAYMIYDTLFALDGDLKIQPQMVEKYDVSDDKLVWTSTLRDGLQFSDGAPVTSEDVIASLKRWGAKDATGLKLMSFVAGFEAVNDRTFRLVLKEPWSSPEPSSKPRLPRDSSRTS